MGRSWFDEGVALGIKCAMLRKLRAKYAVVVCPAGGTEPCSGLTPQTKRKQIPGMLFCELCAFSRLKKSWQIHDSAGSF